MNPNILRQQEESFGENQILTYPDPRLTLKCEDTSIKEANDIIAHLEETLYGENGKYLGYGLASNQIGILKRVCIIRYKGAKMDLVNPVIRIPTERSSCRLETEIEGCLSYPNKEIAVARYNRVVVSADNFGGEIHLSGLWARIVQHEVEHTLGLGLWDQAIVEGRSPCPCGSGKKYRKCCGAKNEFR